MFISVFWKKKDHSFSPYQIDIHSHLIPGIDDGAATTEKSIELLSSLSSLGIVKVITTPHIRVDRFPNTPTIIYQRLKELRAAIQQTSLNISIEVAAEYYLDDYFLKLLHSDSPLLTFGSNYLLFETSFYNKSLLFDEALYLMKARGIQPVLAHPERYQYLEQNTSWLENIHENGVLFQISIPSFAGQYGNDPKKMAQKLARMKQIDFLGSDMHHNKQLRFLKEGLQNRTVKKILSGKLLNHEL